MLNRPISARAVAETLAGRPHSATSPGRWVTSTPGKVSVAASFWSLRYEASQRNTIELRPALAIVSIVLTLYGACSTGVPKRRKTRSRSMTGVSFEGLMERSMYESGLPKPSYGRQ